MADEKTLHQKTDYLEQHFDEFCSNILLNTLLDNMDDCSYIGFNAFDENHKMVAKNFITDVIMQNVSELRGELFEFFDYLKTKKYTRLPDEYSIMEHIEKTRSDDENA